MNRKEREKMNNTERLINALTCPYCRGTGNFTKTDDPEPWRCQACFGTGLLHPLAHWESDNETPKGDDHNDEAEILVIGALLLDPESLPSVCEYLKPQDLCIRT